MGRKRVWQFLVGRLSNSDNSCIEGEPVVSLPTEPQVCLYQLINFIDFDAVDKWIDRYWQAVWSILFVLAGVRRRRNRSAMFLLSYSHFASVTLAIIATIDSVQNFVIAFLMQS